jgi:hypothetical protein
MKAESVDIIKEKLVKTLKKYGDKACLFVMDATGGKQYTGNELATEIENETPFGVDRIFDILHLTIDLMSRDKMPNDIVRPSTEIKDKIAELEARCVEKEKKIADDKAQWNVLNHEKIYEEIRLLMAQKLTLSWVLKEINYL